MLFSKVSRGSSGVLVPLRLEKMFGRIWDQNSRDFSTSCSISCVFLAKFGSLTCFSQLHLQKSQPFRQILILSDPAFRPRPTYLLLSLAPHWLFQTSEAFDTPPQPPTHRKRPMFPCFLPAEVLTGGLLLRLSQRLLECSPALDELLP